MNNEILAAQDTLPPPQNNVREIAAIDLGSNSFHMIVARIVNGSIQVLSRLKQKVKLAEGLDEKGVLNQAAIDRGVSCLALFAERLQGFAAENVKVVGTYTLRSAVNNEEFLRQAAEVFPYPINIISGQTEAKTIYAGVCHTQPEKGRKLVVDIGGGSTEMIIGDDFTPILAESRNMGCVSFAAKYFQNGEISEQNFETAYQSAVKTIEDLGGEYRCLGWQSVLGSSGTIKTVYQVIAATLDPNGIITKARLQDLIHQTLQVSHFDELNITGLNPDRVDVFVPGLAILSAVFDVFHIENMRYSDGALREGVIYSIEQNFQVADIRARTAWGLAEQFNIDVAQAHRIADSADLLASQYSQWVKPELMEEMRSLLLWAARLHEVGIVINHKNRQKHSAYILQNMDLPGFDREQQRLMALLVRFHIGVLKTADLIKFARYDEQDVMVLIRLLRLAVILNKPRQVTEKTRQITLKTHRTSADWVLAFETGYLDRNPLIWNELRQESNGLKDLAFGLVFN
ncbi:exopolyphosphatase [Rodentibacter myodis]|uniref:Exopolyphosphatase n=1 Tax=Rodentibacter myodis TaxID=1907939 RepID=A0A1V3JU99_9PAST|nr:exopolyphosphatase [Rodentibacter myodis]OOF60001.1 exopolyphosphatase [Rodentibacter myodis]